MANGHENPAQWGAVLKPEYRLTVYNYDGAVLSPRTGSAHAEPFRVTTEKTPPAGWRPYLVRPEGRRGRLDVRTRHAELGEMVVRVVDARVGGANLTRWVTAFVGDPNGYNLLKNQKAVLEESLDGGATWKTYFTGRVDIQNTPDPLKEGPYYELVIADHRVEEFRKVFVGAPHRSVAYAMPAPLFPVGAPVMRAGQTSNAGWNGVEGTPPIVAEAYSSDDGGWMLAFPVPFKGSAYQDEYFVGRDGRMLCSEALAAAADPTTDSSETAKAIGRRICTTLRVLVRPRGSGAAWKQLAVAPVSKRGTHSLLSGAEGYDGASDQSALWISKTAYLQGVGCVQLPITHPDHIALTEGSAYEVYVVDTAAPRPDCPLLIDDVNPVTLWEDLAAGKFGHLTENGEVASRPIALDTTAFASLKAEYEKRPVRFYITGPEDMQRFLEEKVFRVVDFAARTTPDGKVQPVGTVLAKGPFGVPETPPTIGEADVLQARWSHGDEFVRSVELVVRDYGATADLDLELRKEVLERKNDKEGSFLRAPGGGVYERTQTFVFLGARAAQSGDSPERIDVSGIRPEASYPGFSFTIPGVPNLRPVTSSRRTGIVEGIAKGYLNWFEDGSAYLHLTCRRVGAAEAAQQGDYVLVETDRLPNAQTNQRGGTRLGVVVERYEKGATVELTILDGGPNQAPVAPTLGNITLVNEGGSLYPQATVTLNASAQAAELEYAFTDQDALARPTTGWEHAAYVLESRAITIRVPLDGKKVWLRARTVRTREYALPSSWVYPANDGQVVSVQPRAANVDVFIENAQAEARWVPNSGAAGVRLYYALSAESENPVLTDYVDVSASVMKYVLPTPVGSGVKVTILVEPWSGWTGSAVSGTLGPSAGAARTAPVLPEGEKPFGTLAAAADDDGAVTLTFAGNAKAVKFHWKASTTGHSNDPTGATVEAASSGVVTVPLAQLEVTGEAIGYVTGWYEGANGELGKRVLAVATARGAQYPIDPTFPLKTGEYLGTLTDIFEGASEAIGLAQQFVFGFGQQAGEGGLPIDKIMTMPVYDPTGLIKLLDTQTKTLHSMVFGSDVQDSANRYVNQMFLKAAPGDPDDARGILYTGGVSLEALRPAEGGAEKTAGKDLSVLAGRTADKLTYTGVGAPTVDALKPAQAGADVTGSNISADVQVGPGKAVAQVGADKTSSNTAANTAAVGAKSAADVADGTARALFGLFTDGKVQNGKVEQTAFVDNLFATNLIVDRVFAANVFTNAVFAKLLAADVGAVRKMVVKETLVAGDIFADKLASITSVLGTIVAGRIMNALTSPTAGIRISSDLEYALPDAGATMFKYIDLSGGHTYFIHHPALKVPHSSTGTVEIKGNLLVGTTYPNGLSELNANADVGTIKAGLLRHPTLNIGIAMSNADLSGWTRYISFNTGNFFIYHEGFTLDHAGNAVFKGNLSAATGTFSGKVTVGGAITSDVYTAGSAGWSIGAGGNAEFNDVTVRGTLYGKMTGQLVDGGEIKSPNYSPGTAGWRILASGDVEFHSGTFRGALSGATGSFKGDLDAAGGTFKGNLKLIADTSQVSSLGFYSTADVIYGSLYGNHDGASGFIHVRAQTLDGATANTVSFSPLKLDGGKKVQALEFEASASGYILPAPDGSRWRITVNNFGDLAAVSA